MNSPAAPFVVVFALFPEVTQLDFTGPWEVFVRLPGAEVIVASEAGGEIVAQAGLRFAGTRRLAEIESCDLICVPGGPGTSAAMLDEAYMAELRRLAAGARYVTSVCTGSTYCFSMSSISRTDTRSPRWMKPAFSMVGNRRS